MAASVYHVISTEVENHIYKTIEFLDISTFINNPHWQSNRILVFLCKYYIVISDTLVGSFLDVLFLLLAVILSERHEKPRRKDWVTEKNLCEGYHFFDYTLSFLCLFRKYENLLFNTTRFFYKQRFFSTHPQCCLAFSWTELQMLLRCYLIHITIIIHFIFYT